MHYIGMGRRNTNPPVMSWIVLERIEGTPPPPTCVPSLIVTDLPKKDLTGSSSRFLRYDNRFVPLDPLPTLSPAHRGT
jgi:hypothetical protein